MCSSSRPGSAGSSTSPATEAPVRPSDRPRRTGSRRRRSARTARRSSPMPVAATRRRATRTARTRRGRTARIGWAKAGRGELHGKSLTRFLPCSQRARMRHALPPSRGGTVAVGSSGEALSRRGGGASRLAGGRARWRSRSRGLLGRHRLAEIPALADRAAEARAPRRCGLGILDALDARPARRARWQASSRRGRSPRFRGSR